MDWIQQWQSKLNKQNGVAPLVRTGGSRHTGLAALPHRNIQLKRIMMKNSHRSSVSDPLKIPLIISMKTVSDEDMGMNSCRLWQAIPDGNLST